jgi:hypothetical protein
MRFPVGVGDERSRRSERRTVIRVLQERRLLVGAEDSRFQEFEHHFCDPSQIQMEDLAGYENWEKSRMKYRCCFPGCLFQCATRDDYGTHVDERHAPEEIPS